MIVEQIQKGNLALQFIDKRIADNKYRGSESSEHNRYDMQEVYWILYYLNESAPEKSLLQIRTTDLTKRAENDSAEYAYAKLCENVKKKVGKNTQDTIRKKIFPDMQRMGLIDRYNRKKQLTIKQKGIKKYVSITDEGLKLVQAKNILDKTFIFSKAVDKLLGGYLEIALDILKDTDYKIDKITKYEFMFFVSAINTDTSFNITTAECVNIIKSYRLLAPSQLKSVVESLKQKLQPKNFVGNKIAKRDWHNWQNKIDQVYHLFNQTAYFNVEGEKKEILILSTKQDAKSGKIKMVRSNAEKKSYFENHKIRQKKAAFDLHHVIPLSWSDDEKQYKLYDKWQNMIYIDGASHNTIHRNSRKVRMSNKGTTIILSDFDNNDIELQLEENIIYLETLQENMLKYNKELLECF